MHEPGFHFVTAVWGQAYVDLFLNVALPCQLAPGNLPAFAGLNGCSYRIYTIPRDVPAITSHPGYVALQSLMHVDLIVNDQLDVVRGRYSVLNHCQNHAIYTANQHDRALVFLSPDALWSDGALGHVRSLVAAGKRVAMQSGVRLNRDSFLPVFRQRFDTTGGRAAAVRSRDVVCLMLDHLHAYSASLFWDSPDFNRWPSQLFWRIGASEGADAGTSGGGVLARCFHLHPLMVWPRRKDRFLNATIDTVYFAHAVPDFDDYAIIDDSDHGVCVELSPPDLPNLLTHIKPDGLAQLRAMQSHPDCPPNCDLKAVAAALFAKDWANDYHRRFIQHPIRFHTGDVTLAFDEVERESAAVVAEILEWAERDPRTVLDNVFGGVLA
jgi:hypothetical protein